MKDTLARTLRLKDLMLIVIGTVIGSGIFLVPGSVLRQTGGDTNWALLVWFVAGILSLLGALTYGELGAMDPEAGGLYVYIRDAFGALPAFLYGWTLFFVISSGSVATLAVAFTTYLNQLVPLTPLLGRAIAVVMIVVLAFINVRGTRKSATVQNWTTIFKVGAILLMSVVLIAAGKGFSSAGDATTGFSGLSFSLLSGIGLAMMGVLWAYEGWQYVTFCAGETIDPQSTFPRGIILGTAATIGIYLIANVAYIAALGSAGAARSDSIAADAVGALLGPEAGKLIATAILVSIFSAANGLTLTAPRVYFAMARDGVFFQKLAEIHPGFQTPAFAIVASSAWAVVLASSGTFEELLTYVVFTGWIFYALGALSIFFYRRHRPDAHRPFRVPGYPFTPILFVLSALAIVLNTLWTQPRNTLLGIGVVLVGTPAFYFWHARSKTP